MPLITGTITDSAGTPANGLIEFTQMVRMDTGTMLVTQAVATAQVVNGTIRDLNGSPFVMPVNPDGTAVRVLERLGGRTYAWLTQVPATDVEYRALPQLSAGSLLPAGFWWDLTGGIDFPPEAAVGDFGWDRNTDNVWRNE
ncbi:hypothetical protein ACIPY5_12055 [Microbacterium sp. NPDC089698]|uniref:hypothetical protein n=1 Tax=Microbacterium sp. NPDC089698 TaxID=3364200 RepID=UPI003818B48C